MPNTRNAGRKAKLGEGQLADIKRRIREGESVSALAREYGISRQALYRNLQDRKPSEIRMDCMQDGELCTRIFFDRKSQAVRIENYAAKLSRRAFGTLEKPDREDLQTFLDDYYLQAKGALTPGTYLLTDQRGRIDILRDAPAPQDGSRYLVIENGASVPQFFFSRTGRLLRRTDTDGFQMKAITSDRRYFIKSQAVMGGVRLRDWAVEIIASDLCRQLAIPCVMQHHAEFVYEGNAFDGVYSENFELDGYTFVSFERLLARNGWSTKEEAFISLSAVEKMKWCAGKLAEAGDLAYTDTLKYMLDLAVIDCLVGNTDRHDKNYGLFFNVNTQRFEIPLIFDNGMGLFENDPYRDRYQTFEEAMHNVYVAPYGEDPFALLEMLDAEFDLRGRYPGIENIVYPDILTTPFALLYERRIKDLWRK